jgi:hypothetical protein
MAPKRISKTSKSRLSGARADLHIDWKTAPNSHPNCNQIAWYDNLVPKSDEIFSKIRVWPGQWAHGDMGVQYDTSGDRFGRTVKTYPLLGELRRQKKKPHKEVFYIFVFSETERKYVLRSIVNCSNDQIVGAIRNVGEKIEGHEVARHDGEEVLDILYAELGRRADVGEHARSKKNKSNAPVGDTRANASDSVSNGQEESTIRVLDDGSPLVGIY